MGSGTAAAQLVTAATAPVLTRVFPPEAHSLWALFLSLTAIFSGVATLRYELAIVLPRERRVSLALAMVGATAAIIASVVAGAFLGAGGLRLFFPTEPAGAWAWCWLVPLSLFSTAIYQLASAWCTRESSFRRYAQAQLALPVGILIGQLSLAAVGWRDAWGLIGGTVVGQVVVAAGLAFASWCPERSLIRALTGHDLRAAAKEYRNYPRYMTPYTLLGVGRERFAYFLLGRLGGAATLGYYNLVARLANLPNSFVASALRPVFFQHAAARAVGELERPVGEIVRALGFLAAVLWGPCVVHAGWLLGLVFGPEWSRAAPYAIALSVPAIPLLMGNWADRLFDVTGRQSTALRLEVGFSFLAIAALVGGYMVFGDLLRAVAVQCGFLASYYLVWLAVLFRCCGFALRGLGATFLLVIVAGAASWAMSRGSSTVLTAPAAFALSAAIALVVAGWYALGAWRRLGKFLGS